MPPNPVLSGHRTGSEIEMVLYDITHNKPCLKLFVPVNNEEFHFFPASFVYYLIYSIALTIIITVGGHSPTTHWLIVYGILILSVWDSFFSWYRYYSTLFISTYFRHVATTTVLQYFIAYGLPYCLLFAAQIHFFYYLFPFALLVHLTFNCVCTWKFASVLIESYHDSMDVFSPEMYRTMLNDVYFMRRVQFICNILSTVSLGCILTSTFIHCIPIIWSVCDLLLTINFARNKVFIYRSAFMFCQYCNKHKELFCKHTTKPPESTSANDHPITTATSGSMDEDDVETSAQVDSISVKEIEPKRNSRVMNKANASKSAGDLNQRHPSSGLRIRIQSDSAPISTNKIANALKINLAPIVGSSANDLSNPMIGIEAEMISVKPSLHSTKEHHSYSHGVTAMKPSLDVLRRAASVPLYAAEDAEEEEAKDTVSLPDIEFVNLSTETATKRETIQTTSRGRMTPVTPMTPAVDACLDVLSAQGFIDIDLVNTIRRSVQLNQTDDFPKIPM